MPRKFTKKPPKPRNFESQDDTGARFMPTLEEIAERAAKVRETWSAQEEQRRMGTNAVVPAMGFHSSSPMSKKSSTNLNLDNSVDNYG